MTYVLLPLADTKRKKENSRSNGKTVENKSGLLNARISRRTAVGTGAAVGAAVVGLVVGVAAGYEAHSGGTSTVTSTVGSGGTQTVTNTVTNTVTSTVGSSGPYTGSITVQTLAGGGDAWAGYVASQYNASHPGANVKTQPIPECNMNAYGSRLSSLVHLRTSSTTRRFLRSTRRL